MKNSWFFWWISFLMLSSLGTCTQDLSMMNNETHEKDTFCDKMEEYNWQSAFHDCFVDRKYKDGGLDLDNIIHRILKHADACTEISRRRRWCRLDYGGFKFVMSKVIEQMKDYSIMYMEAITKGRQNVKDLECVEDILTLQTYVECFKTRIPDPSLGVNVVKRIVEEGLTCANEQNRGCSNEALTTFNRIVKTLLGVKPPRSESSGSAPTTPAVPKEESTTTNRHMENSTSTNRHMEDSTPTNRHMEDSTPTNRHMEDSTSTNRHMEDSTPTNKHMEDSTPTNKHMEDSTPTNKRMEDSTPTNKHMEDSTPTNRHMEDSTPTNRHMEDSTPTNRHMEDSTPTNRHMEDSISTNRHMEDSTPTNRHMVQKVEPTPTTRVQKVEPTPTSRVLKVEPTPTTRHRVQKVGRIPTTRHRVQNEDPTPTHSHRVQKENPTPEPPMRWYQYIFRPFVAVWNFVKSWFG